MMSKKLDIKALRDRRAAVQNQLSAKSKAASAVAKTAKGQRAAVQRAEAAEFTPLRELHDQHCQDGTIVIDDMPTETCGFCYPAIQQDQQQAWFFPVSEAQWLKSLATASADVTGRSLNDRTYGNMFWSNPEYRPFILETARLRDAYKKYERDIWAAPVRFDEAGSFTKVVNTQVARERRGGADLGLLGYSAIDIAQMAVHYAWVRRVCRYLQQIGADQDSVTVLSRALRDRRTNEQLLADAQLGTKERIVLTADLRLRHEDHTAEVRKAREYLVARRVFKASGFDVDCTPSIGDVYRELKGVVYEGVKAFSKNLEGLTQEGIITDQVFYRKVDASGFQSVDDVLFTEHVFNEQELRREAIVDVLANELSSLTVAEADSFVMLEALQSGASLLDIKKAFGMTNRKFNQTRKGMESIVARVSNKKVERRIKQLKAEILAAA